MAKVSGPLFSFVASGRIESLVYDRRGFVRKFAPPTNPTSQAQGNVRQIMLASQRAIGITGSTTRADLKEAFALNGLPAYRWNAYLLQMIIGSGGQAWEASKNTYNNTFNDDQRTAWNSDAEAAGLPQQVSVSYASDGPIPAGLAMLALANAVYALGVHEATGQPSGDNSSDWKAALVS